MKAKLLLVMALAAVVVLAGCGSAKVSNQPQAQNQENKGIFASIRDAFNRSLTLRCDYTDETGNKSVNYIKNKMIRTETVQSGQPIYAIFRDNKMYLWGMMKGQGIVYNLSDLNKDNVNAGGTEIKSTDDFINELEKFKDKCQVSTAPDSLFEVPKDIKFSSMSDFLKQLGQ